MLEFKNYFPKSVYFLLDDTKIKPPIKLGYTYEDEFVNEKQKEYYSLHFSFNQFRNESRKIEDCIGINAWAIDMDAKDVSIIAQEVRIKQCPVKPSIIIRSKNGYHCYWLAREGKMDNYRAIMERLITYFDADKSCTSINKSLRVPHFLHLKDPESPFEVLVVRLKEIYYSETEMLDAYPEPIKIGGMGQQFWQYVSQLNNEEMLLRFSGTPLMRDEIITFRPNSNGTKQIVVNGKSSSSWIDADGFIGSHDGGGVTFIQWLQWYGNSKSAIAKALVDMGIVKMDTKPSFIAYDELLEFSETERKKINYNTAIQYGISCLDHSLRGILRDELVVIGAHTGVGKTELAFKIELHNAARGKQVYGIHLEGRLTEITNRHIFNEIRKISDADLSYMDFMMNTQDTTGVARAALDSIKKQISKNLKIFNRTSFITVDDFVRIVRDIQHDADLIVIDHLHYFDMKDYANERTEINRIMQELKQLTDIYRIPIVLVSHLRRPSSNDAIPSENDLMGSSNIAKQADAVILVFPNYTIESSHAEGIYPTFMRHTKSRLGLPKNVFYSINYDATRKEYFEDYDVYNYDLKSGGIQRLEHEKYPYYLIKQKPF